MNQHFAPTKTLLILCIMLGVATAQAQPKEYNSITIGKQEIPLIWNAYYAIEWNWKYFYERQKPPIDVTKTIQRLEIKYPTVAFYVFEPEWPAAFMIIGKDGKKVSYSILEQLIKEPEIRALSQTVQFYNENAPLTFFAPSITLVLDPYNIHNAKAHLKDLDLKLHNEQGQILFYQVSKPIIDSNYPDFVDKIRATKYVELVEPNYYSKVELDHEGQGLIED